MHRRSFNLGEAPSSLGVEVQGLSSRLNNATRTFYRPKLVRHIADEMDGEEQGNGQQFNPKVRQFTCLKCIVPPSLVVFVLIQIFNSKFGR